MIVSDVVSDIWDRSLIVIQLHPSTCFEGVMPLLRVHALKAILINDRRNRLYIGDSLMFLKPFDIMDDIQMKAKHHKHRAYLAMLKMLIKFGYSLESR